MATDVGIGDSELGYLDVAPADTDTVATLTVIPPPAVGSSYSVDVTAGDLEAIPDSDDLKQRWTSDDPIAYSAAGRWILRWEVTGTGEGAEDFEVYVVASPVAGGPTWTPGRSRAAIYVPHRTLVRSLASTTSSQDQYLHGWDSSTVPTGIQVDRLIADGVAWVSARVSPMNPTSYDLASTCAAIFCAAMIERSWPDDDQSLQRANDLERRLDTLMTDLIAANNSANGTDDFGIEIVPIWSFPRSDCRWDNPSYF